jgi:hypothetical protein
MITNGYCTTEQLLIHNENTGDNTQAMTNRCEQAISQASRFIDLYTGRIFYTATLTAEKVDVYSLSANGLYLNFDRRNRVYSPAPFLTITQLLEDSQSVGTENTDWYQYNPVAGQIGDGMLVKDGGGSWSGNNKAISITGTIGYASTPWEVVNLCLKISSLILRAKESFLTNSAGNIVGQLETVLPKLTLKTLQLLRRRIIV